MSTRSNSILKSARTALLASAVAIAAVAAAPQPGNILAVSNAHAEAVQLQAPAHSGFADVVAAVSPAVVSVRVEQMIRPASDRGDYRFDRRGGDDLPEFFRQHPEFFDRFFNERGPRGERREDRRERRFGMSQGSGFFISEDGYLVTNNHVIDGGSKYVVVMDDGTELEARLVGADERSDLAVLKVEEERSFTYVAFSEDEPRIGDWVVAVGNPFGLGGTVTAGIVSAHNREIASNRYDDFIQIDAAVNKGNSGGPAFNLKGEVIGVNTAIFSPSGGNVGIAFAIPARTTSEIVGEIMQNGSVVRGWLGVQIQPVTPDIAEALGLDEAGGALVSEAQSGSPAEAAGIRSGDIITEVDGEDVRGPRELARLIADRDPDETVDLTVIRNGNEQEVEVRLGELAQTAMGADAPSQEEGKRTGKLGLALGSNPEGGVLVMEVAPDSAADEKGIEAGDIIGQVNGEDVATPQDVARLVGDAEKAGRKSTLLRIERNGRSRFVAVPLPRA